MAKLDIYDLTVIGAGMIGSAAAKYACKSNQDLKICLVGPDEPKVTSQETVHGAYFDAARIYTPTHYLFEWSVLAQESIKRYEDIQNESGLAFFTEVGCLLAATPGCKYLENIQKNCADRKVDVEILNRDELKQRFNYLKFPANISAAFRLADAGHINPRILVEAQQKIFTKHGGVSIRDAVTEIEKDEDTDTFTVFTRSGQPVLSHKILLAMGSYSAYLPKFTTKSKVFKLPHLSITNVTETVILMEISEDDAKRLRHMPEISYDGEYWGQLREEYLKLDVGDWSFDPEQYSCYILAPVRYPDGKIYIKIGHGDVFSHIMHNEEDIIKWYQSREGDPGARKMLAHEIQTLLPDVKAIYLKSDGCVTSRTPTRLPYVDIISPGVGVACGGNGYAAKSCDEIGRIAAKLITESLWDSVLEREKFQVHVQ